MNRRLYVTNATEFGVQEINIYEDSSRPADRTIAAAEHSQFLAVERSIGSELVEQLDSPADAKDFVYAANQFFCLDDVVTMAQLPIGRETEVPFVKPWLTRIISTIHDAPYLYSGQGDTLYVPPTSVRAGFILMGYGHRTDQRMAQVLKDTYRVEVYALTASTKRHWWGGRSRNKVTGLWNSYWYDLDIAIGIIDATTIAVCLGALTRKSRDIIKRVCREQGLDLISVSVTESRDGFGCNLVSNGIDVVMSDGAPLLSAELERRGKIVHRLHNSELRKGGGGYRCISTALDNQTQITKS